MKKITLSIKLGIILAVLHLLLFIYSSYLFLTASSGQAITGYFYIYLVDLFLAPLLMPASYLCGLLNLPFIIAIIFVYGILGTLAWFFIPYLVKELILIFKSRGSKK